VTTDLLWPRLAVNTNGDPEAIGALLGRFPLAWDIKARS
jgi:hypothetical protein